VDDAHCTRNTILARHGIPQSDRPALHFQIASHRAERIGEIV
jgi:hypothetical protein